MPQLIHPDICVATFRKVAFKSAFYLEKRTFVADIEWC